MNGFNEQYFATGSLGPFTVGNYSCRSRDETHRELEGRSVTCTRPGVRLEAMLPHPLGGFVVDSTDPYTIAPVIGISRLSFDANGLRCDLHPQGGYSCADLAEYKNYGDTQYITYGPGATEPTYASSNDLTVPDFLTGERLNLPEGQVISFIKLACLNDGVGVTCTNGTVTAHISTANLGRP